MKQVIMGWKQLFYYSFIICHKSPVRCCYYRKKLCFGMKCIRNAIVWSVIEDEPTLFDQSDNNNVSVI